MTAQAEVTDPATLLPESCVVYAELRAPRQLLSTILDHPLRSEIEATPQFMELRKNPEFQKLQIGLRLVEFKLRKLWRPALEAATGGGIAVGVDAVTEGVVLLVRAEDAEFLGKARDTLLEMVRENAPDDGDENRLQEVDYRGITAYRMGPAGFAVNGHWLVLTNNRDLGKAVLDRLLGDDVATLAENATFQSAREAAPTESTLWAWGHLATLREQGLAEDLFRGHAEEFGGEMIIGGVLAALKEAPYATASLRMGAEGVQISASVPATASKLAEEAVYFYGMDATAAAPRKLHVPRQIGSIRAYRDLAALWVRAPDLFDDRVNAEMAQAESNLATLAGGRDFADDILGAIGPDVQIVVATQDYQAADVPEPAIKLPGFAAVFTLRDPEKSQRIFKIAYQQVVGFINLNAGQQGYPPLDLNSQQQDGTLLVSATYLREDLERYASENSLEEAARLQANFSPTAAFTGDRFILSSTQELARELIDAIQGASESGASHAAPPPGATVNTAIDVRADQLRAILQQNREHLINQNMLGEGHDRPTAEREIDSLLKVLGWLDSAQLQLAQQDDELRLSLELRVGVE